MHPTIIIHAGRSINTQKNQGRTLNIVAQALKADRCGFESQLSHFYVTYRNHFSLISNVGPSVNISQDENED